MLERHVFRMKGGDVQGRATWGTEASEATAGFLINKVTKSSSTTRQKISPEFCVGCVAGVHIFSGNFHTETIGKHPLCFSL